MSRENDNSQSRDDKTWSASLGDTARDIDSGEILGCTPQNDDEFNQTLATFQDGLSDWRNERIDFAGILRTLRDWSDELWDRFIPKEWNGHRIPRPCVAFRFCVECPRVLGHYHPGRNDAGLRWEISVNPRHLRVRAQAQVAATVLHELIHCFEDVIGKTPRSRNNYHSVWFRKHARSAGIPSGIYGQELGIADPSPFALWAHERGLTFDGTLVPSLSEEEEPVCRNKRVVWECACPTGRMVRVMVARGSELAARCERCGELYRHR